VKPIKKIIKEEMGIQKDVHELTDYIFNEIKDIKIDEGSEIQKIIKTPSNIRDTILVDYILLYLSNGDNDGSFVFGETKIVNGFYRVSLKLKINMDEIDKLKSVISHELNHVYVYLKKYKTKQKTLKYNQVFHMLKHEFNQYEPLKNFIHLLYLNLPEEIQARIQETQVILDSINNNDYNEVIRELYRYQPMNDGVRMINFNTKDILKLDESVLKQFIKTFNINKTYQGLEDNKINGIKQFFNYWCRYINKGGDKLNKKILKLVVKKYHKNENNLYEGIHTELLKEIFYT
jgi:hypothetical protein